MLTEPFSVACRYSSRCCRAAWSTRDWRPGPGG